MAPVTPATGRRLLVHPDADPKLVIAGLVEAVSEGGRSGYAVTERGRDLEPIVAALARWYVHHAIGDRLHCIFVDNGLLRKGERDGGNTAGHAQRAPASKKESSS